MEEFFKSHNTHSIFWSAIGHGGRIEVIQACEDIINKFGFINEFKQFSDLALSMSIEVSPDKIRTLYESLKDNLRLDPFDFKEVNENTKNVFLNISFADGHGDLRVEVPQVPG